MTSTGRPPREGAGSGQQATATGYRAQLALEFPSQPGPVPDPGSHSPGDRSPATTRDEGLLLTGPVPQSGQPDESAGGRVVQAEWALWGKDANVPGYHVLRCSDGALHAADFHQLVNRYASGAKETLPQYTIYWIPDSGGGVEYLGVGIHELADRDPDLAGGRVRASRGREIEYIRLFCVRYDDLAGYGATYQELTEAVKDNQLPTELTGPIAVSLPEIEPLHPVESVRMMARTVATLLLTTRPVYIVGGEDVPVEDRLRFIDYVMSLLPYGLRATLSASTWASPTARALKLRLFFTNARRAEEDGISVSWSQPARVNPEAAELPLRHYANWLAHGDQAGLGDMTDPIRFAADDIRKMVVGLPAERPIGDVLEELADGLARHDAPVVQAAVKRLQSHQRNYPPDGPARLWFRQEIERLSLLREHRGLNQKTVESVYRVLVRLAFVLPLSYAGYCEILDLVGGAPSGALRRVVLGFRFKAFVPWLLASLPQDEFSDGELRETLREQGTEATAPLDEVQRGVRRLRREHRAVAYDFAVRYLRLSARDAKAELVRMGYLTATVEGAFPGDLKAQRIRLEETLRFVYGSLLSEGQVRELYDQPGLKPTPAFDAAVERMRLPAELPPAKGPAGARNRQRPNGQRQALRSRVRDVNDWELTFKVRAVQVVLGLALIAVIVIVILVLHLAG